MPDITTLVKDINRSLSSATSSLAMPDTVVAHDIARLYKPDTGTRQEKTLYFSEIGEPCLRKLWYKVNDKTGGEELPPSALIKFQYGNMLEDLVLKLAYNAGHTVEKRQERMTYELAEGWKVTGKIDAVIDGVMVDVKSVTANSEKKFAEGLVDDPFGYYTQLNGYAVSGGYSSAGFLTIQKELGHINYYPFNVSEKLFKLRAETAVQVVQLANPDKLPVLASVPQTATSKNQKLCTACSYCPYKKKCFPALRAFSYSFGPVFLTKVVDEPKVREIVL